MKHYADRYERSSKNSNSGKTTHSNVQEYEEKNKKIRREKEAFLQREFDYRDYIFAPEGYEGVMLFLYVVTIPYLVGLAFLFLFVVESSFSLFLELNLASYFIIWAIGYEICAVSALVIIFYAWLRGDNSEDSSKGGASGRGKAPPRFRN